MTDREKIIEIVLNADITGIKIRNITGGISTAKAIADALIAAGMGDVKEAEHRAEVAERALKNICKNIRIDGGDNEDEIKANSNVLYKAYLKQAERELQEELEYGNE